MFLVPRIYRMNLATDREGELLIDADGFPTLGEDGRYRSDFLVLIWLGIAWPFYQGRVFNTLTGKEI